MAPHNLAHLRVLFLLMSIATITSAFPTSDDSSLCAIPSPAPKHVPAGEDEALPLLRSFQLNAGYFFGGEDIHFTKEDGDDGNVSYSYVTRSFSMLPHHVERTVDPALLHVAATLTLTGGRARQVVSGRRRRRRYRFVDSHSVSFYLDGYYSVTSAELCMAGSGTYSEDYGSMEHLPGVVLDLRVPNPSSLLDPFVTGRLEGAGFRTISLVAYAEGDAYQYGHGDSAASCPPPPPSSSTVKFAPLAPGGAADFSCARLKELLVNSYKLQHGFAASPLAGLDEPLMHVSQVRCAAGGAVRAYAAFYNDTAEEWRTQPRPPFMVSQEVVVAEGHWDSARRMLCLRACRWVRSGTSVVAKECGIGMSFWFPGVWTIRDRSAVAGMLWNSSHAAGGSGGSGVISVSSVDDGINNLRSNFSDVKYDYNHTMVEEAKKHYLNYKKTVKRSFLAPNYTDHDFEFEFYEGEMLYGRGNAYPVAIGSAIVYGDPLAADESFSRHAPVVDAKHDALLSVSYDIRRYVPPASWVRPTNVSSYSIPHEEHRIRAEGVFDPKMGILCMVGCRELSGSTDCQLLVTVQFASLDERAWGHGRGVIRSLRDKADHLFFNKTEIALYGMYTEQVSESISRMDLESVMLVVSTTLPCFFTALQILHAKNHPEASAATSVTMLVVLALGHVAALVVSSEALFLSRRMHYSVPFLRDVPYELSQAVLRAPTLIAFVLQLRLIQLAWSGRKSAAAADRSKAEASSVAAERRALWVCLPLYLLGAAVTVVVHVISSRATAGEDDSLAVRVEPEPATLWEDLVSSAGLAQDAFLLPQVVINAFSPSSGAGVKAVSPWFYVGGTVVRAMPHVYDVMRRLSYVPSLRPSYVYAGPRDDRFGVAWDVVVPCVTTLLAVVVYLQQRGGGAFVFLRSRRSGGYEMVSTI